MSELRFTETEIVAALRAAESGASVAETCRRLGCSEAMFYVWKMRAGRQGPVVIPADFTQAERKAE